MEYKINTISKVLSSNDIGLTKSHQSCILIPAKAEVTAFFPVLMETEKNPRVLLNFYDENNKLWIFNYIHYNDKIIEGGFKNEYRLTSITGYMKEKKLNPGDTIILERSDDGVLRIMYERKSKKPTNEPTILKINGGWRVIKY